MVPASFASMILRMLLGKKMLPKLIEAISEPIANKMAKMFKLPQVVNYMELPNPTDLKVEQQEDHIKMLAGEISMLETRLNKLEILSNKSKKLKSNG